MGKIYLYFDSVEKPELFRIDFHHPSLNAPRTSVRGKSALLSMHSGSFQWTAAVKAMSVLLLKRAAQFNAQLSGESGSQAASLDYALGKQPRWMKEVFGSDAKDNPLVAKLFLRSNPESKLPGPVSVALRMTSWSRDPVCISIGGTRVEDVTIIREILNNLDADYSANPLAKSTHGDFQAMLRSALYEEVSSMLAFSDIFDSSRYSKILNSITSSRSFREVVGTKKFAISKEDVLLPSTAKLGMEPESGFLKKHLCPGQAIRVELAAPGAATSALFFYLSKVKKYHFDLSFRFPHAVAIARELIKGTLNPPPDICALGIAPSATLIARGNYHEYSPLMLLPKVGQKIVAASSYEQNSRTHNESGDYARYNLISDEPSVPSFMLNDLIDEGHLKRNQLEVSHLEPDETFIRLKEGDLRERAILFFPHFHYNTWYNDCKILKDPRSELKNQEFVLFAHQKFTADKNRKLALIIALRDAWLELKMRPELLQRVIELMVSDCQYTSFLARCGGLQHQEEFRL